jgi:hypothetical protein
MRTISLDNRKLSANPDDTKPAPSDLKTYPLFPKKQSGQSSKLKPHPNGDRFGSKASGDSGAQ